MASREFQAPLNSIPPGFANPEDTLDVVRAKVDASSDPIPLPGTDVEHSSIGDIPIARVVRPGADDSRTLVFFHSGAFVHGSARSSVGVASLLSISLKSRVVVERDAL